ncbi:MAG: LysM domain-containing protein [Gemmatimonadota bacterium]|nr:LysM domain-containing protein [Gemmatimonadota bacterium]
MVEPGETWLAVAHRFRVNLSDLEDANPRFNPNRLLLPGYELVIPRE